MTLQESYQRAMAAAATRSDFATHLGLFIDYVNSLRHEYYSDFFKENKTFIPKPMETQSGVKNVRIIASDLSSRSAWAFVNKETGDIYKAASWASPAKHARGNIYAPQDWPKWINVYGPAYLK